MELSREALLDQSSWDVIELNMCRSQRCHTFGARIGQIAKTYDYINRVVMTLLLTVYEGTWTTLFPSRCYASPR